MRFAGTVGWTVLLVAAGACEGGREAPGGAAALGDTSVEARVDSLLARMTLEEKVGQMIQADVRKVTPEDVRTHHLGSVLNGGGGFPNGDKHAGVEDWLALADAMWAASTDAADGRNGIPVIWGVDAVHGHNNVVGATIFPHNIGLGAARDPDLVRRIGEATARELRVTGHDWNFGPTLAVPRDDRWGRTYEGYSEDPSLVAEYAGAMVRGLQGEPGTPGFLDDHHVIATAKHFIADGGTSQGRDQGQSAGTDDELRAIHARGYVSALDAGVQSVMASFSSWNGVKMHAHRGLLTGTLKEAMGFDGLLVGDWNGHGQVPGCSNSSCAATVNAGLDMFMVPDDWRALYGNTLEQVRAGEIPVERLDDAVRRILRVKVRAGVLDRDRPSHRPLAGDRSVLGAAEHRALARQAVRQSMVLLKNDGQLLPLDPGVHVLVVGDGAHDIGKQAGGWTLTWQGTGNGNEDFPGATSIWEGIRAAVERAGGTAVLSPEGAIHPGNPPDVVVAVYGEDPYAEYQGDRADVGYPRGDGRELRMLQSFRESGIPVVSVFLSGRPLWVVPELNASDAFVAAWLPGSEGAGIADVLFRSPDGTVAHDFRGRLSFSWPRRPDQVSLNVGDPGYDPLFPFGYGLTYADAVELGPIPEDLGTTRPAAGPSVYFDGGAVPPWRLLVRGAGPEELPALAGRTGTPGGEVTVSVEDRRRQEDARRVTWSGTGPGSVVLVALDGEDLRPDARMGRVLAFDLRVDEVPGVPLFLALARADSTTIRQNLTRRLRDMPPGEWVTLRIPLRCLETPGLELAQVTAPWGLQSDGPAALAFSDVRLEDGGETLSCG